jgi:hypothetical protein
MVKKIKISEIIDDKINISTNIRNVNIKDDNKYKKKFDNIDKKSEINQEPTKENTPNVVNKENNTQVNKKSKEEGCHCLIQ